MNPDPIAVNPDPIAVNPDLHPELPACVQLGSTLGCMVVMHVAAPDVLKLRVERQWRCIKQPPLIDMVQSMDITTHMVLSAMAAGLVPSGHACMAHADIPTAMAAVRALLPDLAAGRTLISNKPDVVGSLCTLPLVIAHMPFHGSSAAQELHTVHNDVQASCFL